MFNITHTTPKRVLSHLLRLQREGEALLRRDDLDFIAQGRWCWRVMQYLPRILADRRMLERLPPYQLRALTPEEVTAPPEPLPLSLEKYRPGLRKGISTLLTTLTSIIDQLEAHIESLS